MSNFPQYNNAARTGEAGVNLVSTIVSNKLRWIFRRTHTEHDFGIDGYIDIVTSAGEVTGRTLAVQIKCGKSYLNEKTQTGYVYRGEGKHLNYLINHPIPVIIILCDLDNMQCYWIDFDPLKTATTGISWKISIPFQNTLQESSAQLQELAGAAKDYTEELNAFWELNNLLDSTDHILYIIDPEDIQKSVYDNVLAFFERLTVNQGVAISCQGKVEISVFGYDEDPRELFEIDIVKEYLTELDHKLEHAFFFLRSEPNAGSLKLLAGCACDAKWESARASMGNPAKVVFDRDKYNDFFERHFIGSNKMIDRLNMSIEKNKKISFSVMRLFGTEPPTDKV